jgi:hypothetical protein
MGKFANGVNRAVQVGAIFLAVLYFTSGILYLCLSYWTVTEQDFWQIYQVCFYYPGIQSALFKIHNHSLFFPSFFWLADLRFFHGSQNMQFIASLFLMAVSTCLFLVPVWRDPTVDFTFKCLGTLTIICSTFWMGRATITTSGGFNCMTSLVTLGAGAAFLFLPKMRTGSPHFLRTTILLVCAGILATFSFGSGAAVWPTLLFLGWSLRLPWRSLAILIAATIFSVLVYRVLPPPEDSADLWKSLNSTPLIAVATLKHLCEFLGAPVFYSVTAWEGVRPSSTLIESSGLLLWAGATGLVLAFIALAWRAIRRHLEGNNLEFLGLALISFNFCVSIIAVASRVERFRDIPVEAAAPRYLFWTSLFWAGLLLVALHHASGRNWLRWPCVFLVFAFSIAGWQEHRDEGLHWRYARYLSDEGATSLINGVADPARLLAPNQEQVDLLAPQLRARRLDMFAEGLQDWIGQPVTQLFRGRRDSRHFRGQAAIQRLVGGRDQSHAVKVSGRLFANEAHPQQIMVIVDPNGTVVGIARSFESNKLLNRLLYGGRMPSGQLAGYIRDYNPAFHYVLRAAGKNGLSQEQIAILPLPDSLGG